MARIVIAILLLCNIAWFFVVASIAIRGNIAEKSLVAAEAARQLEEKVEEPERSHDSIDSRTLGGVAKRFLVGRINSSMPEPPDPAEYHHAKRSVAERFKASVAQSF